MVATKLREFLDGNQVKYVTLAHPPAFTANETAASAYVSDAVMPYARGI